MSERFTIDEKIARARIVPDIRGREPFVHDIVESHLALSSAIEPINHLKEAVMNRGDADEILTVSMEAVEKIIGLALTVAEPARIREALRTGEVRNLFTHGNGSMIADRGPVQTPANPSIVKK